MAKPANSVDEYLAALSPKVRKSLASLRKAITSAAPKAEEKISYSLPYYKQNGALTAFVSHKNHCSFITMSYSVIMQFKDELKSFKVSGTTIQFQPDKPVPLSLVKKIIKARIKENESKIKVPSKKGK